MLGDHLELTGGPFELHDGLQCRFEGKESIASGITVLNQTFAVCKVPEGLKLESEQTVYLDLKWRRSDKAIAQANALALRPLLRAVNPTFEQLAGGSHLVLEGEGFPRCSVRCSFEWSSNTLEIEGEYISDKIVHCTSARAQRSGKMKISLSFCANSVQSNHVDFWYFSPPLIYARGPVFTYSLPKNISVYGAGFVENQFFKCRSVCTHGIFTSRGDVIIGDEQAQCLLGPQLPDPMERFTTCRIYVANSRDEYSTAFLDLRVYPDLANVHIVSPVVHRNPEHFPESAAVWFEGRNFALEVDVRCIFDEKFHTRANSINDTHFSCLIPIQLMPGLAHVQVVHELDQSTSQYGNFSFTLDDVKLEKPRPLFGATSGGTLIRLGDNENLHNFSWTCEFGGVSVPVLKTVGNAGHCVAPETKQPGAVEFRICSGLSCQTKLWIGRFHYYAKMKTMRVVAVSSKAVILASSALSLPSEASSNMFCSFTVANVTRNVRATTHWEEASLATSTNDVLCPVPRELNNINGSALEIALLLGNETCSDSTASVELKLIRKASARTANVTVVDGLSTLRVLGENLKPDWTACTYVLGSVVIAQSYLSYVDSYEVLCEYPRLENGGNYRVFLDDLLEVEVQITLFPLPYLKSLFPVRGLSNSWVNVSFFGGHFTDTLHCVYFSRTGTRETVVTAKVQSTNTATCLVFTGNSSEPLLIGLKGSIAQGAVLKMEPFAVFNQMELSAIRPEIGEVGTETLVEAEILRLVDHLKRFPEDEFNMFCDFEGTRVRAAYLRDTHRVVCTAPPRNTTGSIPFELVDGDGENLLEAHPISFTYVGKTKVIRSTRDRVVSSVFITGKQDIVLGSFADGFLDDCECTFGEVRVQAFSNRNSEIVCRVPDMTGIYVPGQLVDVGLVLYASRGGGMLHETNEFFSVRVVDELVLHSFYPSATYADKETSISLSRDKTSADIASECRCSFVGQGVGVVGTSKVTVAELGLKCRASLYPDIDIELPVETRLSLICNGRVFDFISSSTFTFLPTPGQLRITPRVWSPSTASNAVILTGTFYTQGANLRCLATPKFGEGNMYFPAEEMSRFEVVCYLTKKIAPGLYDIGLVSDSLESYGRTGTLEILPRVIVRSVSPKVASVLGGTAIPILGANFVERHDLSCTFEVGNDVPIKTSAAWVDSTQLRCITPTLKTGQMESTSILRVAVSSLSLKFEVFAAEALTLIHPPALFDTNSSWSDNRLTIDYHFQFLGNVSLQERNVFCSTSIVLSAPKYVAKRINHGAFVCSVGYDEEETTTEIAVFVANVLVGVLNGTRVDNAPPTPYRLFEASKYHLLGSDDEQIYVKGQNIAYHPDLLCVYFTELHRVSVSAKWISTELVICPSPVWNESHGDQFLLALDSPAIKLQGSERHSVLQLYLVQRQLFTSAEVLASSPLRIKIAGENLSPTETVFCNVGNETVEAFWFDVSAVECTLNSANVPESNFTLNITMADSSKVLSSFELSRPSSQRITTIQPKFGPLSGGTLIRVFLDQEITSVPVVCHFGSEVSNVQYVSQNQVACNLPRGKVGFVQVWLSLEDGVTVKAKQTFEYQEDIAISGLEPQTVTAYQPITLQVKGGIFLFSNTFDCVVSRNAVEVERSRGLITSISSLECQLSALKTGAYQVALTNSNDSWVCAFAGQLDVRPQMLIEETQISLVGSPAFALRVALKVRNIVDDTLTCRIECPDGNVEVIQGYSDDSWNVSCFISLSFVNRKSQCRVVLLTDNHQSNAEVITLLPVAQVTRFGQQQQVAGEHYVALMLQDEVILEDSVVPRCSIGDKQSEGNVIFAASMAVTGVLCPLPTEVVSMNKSKSVHVGLTITGVLVDPVLTNYVLPSVIKQVVEFYPALGPAFGGTSVTILLSNLEDAGYNSLQCRFKLGADLVYQPMYKLEHGKFTCLTPSVKRSVFQSTQNKWHESLVATVIDETELVFFPTVFKFYEPPQIYSTVPSSLPMDQAVEFSVVGKGFFASKDLRCTLGLAQKLLVAQYINETMVRCTSPLPLFGLAQHAAHVVGVSFNQLDIHENLSVVIRDNITRPDIKTEKVCTGRTNRVTFTFGDDYGGLRCRFRSKTLRPVVVGASSLHRDRFQCSLDLTDERSDEAITLDVGYASLPHFSFKAVAVLKVVKDCSSTVLVNSVTPTTITKEYSGVFYFRGVAFHALANYSCVLAYGNKENFLEAGYVRSTEVECRISKTLSSMEVMPGHKVTLKLLEESRLSGSSAVSQAFELELLPPPRIWAVSPLRVLTPGGTELVISGAHLDSAVINSCRFSDGTMSPLQLYNSTIASCRLPLTYEKDSVGFEVVGSGTAPIPFEGMIHYVRELEIGKVVASVASNDFCCEVKLFGSNFSELVDILECEVKDYGRLSLISVDSDGLVYRTTKHLSPGEPQYLLPLGGQ